MNPARENLNKEGQEGRCPRKRDMVSGLDSKNLHKTQSAESIISGKKKGEY
jgi:hypothetical protein